MANGRQLMRRRKDSVVAKCVFFIDAIVALEVSSSQLLQVHFSPPHINWNSLLLLV